MEEAKFIATVEILKENEIAADGYWGCIWCSEEYNPGSAYFFSLEDGNDDWDVKYATLNFDRVALAF